MINKLKEDLLFINKEIVTAANDGLTHRLIKTHLLGLNNILSDLIRNLQSDLKVMCISCTKENENCRLNIENEQLKQEIEDLKFYIDNYKIVWEINKKDKLIKDLTERKDRYYFNCLEYERQISDLIEKIEELEQYKKSKQASYEAMQRQWNEAVNENKGFKKLFADIAELCKTATAENQCDNCDGCGYDLGCEDTKCAFYNLWKIKKIIKDKK